MDHNTTHIKTQADLEMPYICLLVGGIMSSSQTKPLLPWIGGMMRNLKVSTGRHWELFVN